MPVTDPVADMLTRIRNAIVVRQDVVNIPASRMKGSIAEILKSEGFIQGYDVIKSGTPQATIRVRLHYRGRNEPAISGLKRVSKPGLRVYVQRQEIPRPFGGLGIAIVSTSQGIITGREAYRRGVGGELLCYVW
jgi:small subunit ribosomal protein S8